MSEAGAIISGENAASIGTFKVKLLEAGDVVVTLGLKQSTLPYKKLVPFLLTEKGNLSFLSGKGKRTVRAYVSF